MKLKRKDIIYLLQDSCIEVKGKKYIPYEWIELVANRIVLQEKRCK